MSKGFAGCANFCSAAVCGAPASTPPAGRFRPHEPGGPTAAPSDSVCLGRSAPVLRRSGVKEEACQENPALEQTELAAPGRARSTKQIRRTQPLPLVAPRRAASVRGSRLRWRSSAYWGILGLLLAGTAANRRRPTPFNHHGGADCTAHACLARGRDRSCGLHFVMWDQSEAISCPNRLGPEQRSSTSTVTGEWMFSCCRTPGPIPPRSINCFIKRMTPGSVM